MWVQCNAFISDPGSLANPLHQSTCRLDVPKPLVQNKEFSVGPVFGDSSEGHAEWRLVAQEVGQQAHGALAGDPCEGLGDAEALDGESRDH